MKITQEAIKKWRGTPVSGTVGHLELKQQKRQLQVLFSAALLNAQGKYYTAATINYDNY